MVGSSNAEAAEEGAIGLDVDAMVAVHSDAKVTQMCCDNGGGDPYEPVRARAQSMTCEGCLQEACEDEQPTEDAP